ncbi:MAG: TetR/AcrR family transcriptional regulator [Myxococcota bacterium]
MARQGPREEVLDAVEEVFRDHGYHGATLSRLSEATGLGRASLYHHFPGGKEDMARAIFLRAGEQLAASLSGEGTPEERLESFLGEVEAIYARGQRNPLLGAMVLGGGWPRFEDELAEGFRQWTDAFAGLARAGGVEGREARRRAEDAVARLQGSLVVTRGLGKPAVFRRALAELPGDLLA